MQKPKGIDDGYDAYYEYLKSNRWRVLRTRRLVLDDFRCALCGSANQLHVHHIYYPVEYGTENINDLITLCQTCHGLIEKLKKEGRYSGKWKICDFEMYCIVRAESKMEICDFVNNSILPVGNIECYFCLDGEPDVLGEYVYKKNTNLIGIGMCKKYFGNNVDFRIFNRYR